MERLVVVVRRRGCLGIADGAKMGRNEFIYCTNTRDPVALKEEVSHYLRTVYGVKPERFELIIRDMRDA